MILLIVGITGAVFAQILTMNYHRGIPVSLWEYTAGTGIVPRWVSTIAVLSYLCIFIGLIWIIL